MAADTHLMYSDALAAQFDQEWYLKSNPDVSKAFADGSLKNPRMHFILHGAKEGRAPFRFQKDWYLAAYPLAREEIDSGIVSDALEHFLSLGLGRGYLP